MTEEELKTQEQTPEEVQAIRTTEFMKETIKQRPINKKKLMRRLLSSIALAIIFGLVACITFVLLEPVINKRINPEPEEDPVEQIVFEEESVAEEMRPEDMIAEESELLPVVIEQGPLNDDQIEQVLSEMELGIEDYLTLNAAVSSKIREVQDSMVDVIGITQDTDWFQNEYENEHIISGVIVADNGKEFLILADVSALSSYDSLEVCFNDGKSYDAHLKVADSSTGLGIVAVNKTYMSHETRDQAAIIEMGSSANRNINGTPIIAIGRPLGTVSSVCIGTVTSSGTRVEYTDASYSGITTDIYGSTQASGALVNARGQLVGIIEMGHNAEDMENLVSGLGITELKRLIEAMSNGRRIPYLGIHGTDVTEKVSDQLEIPKGVYLQNLEMDSPMLEAGIQSGDIITQFGDMKLSSYQELNMLMLNYEPEDEVLVTIMRQGPEGYSAMEMTVTLGTQP